MSKILPLLLISLLLALAACGDGEEQQPFCGDGARDEGEKCDGADLSGETCKGLGFSGGDLGCKATCADFDRSNCNAPKSCGNNKREGIETCDGSDLAGKTCEALGYGKGALSCAPNCADFDVSGCGALATCGNNKKDPGEACDGTDLAGATCKGFGFKDGTLKCGIKCLGYDKSGCVKDCVPDCQGRKCGLDPVCGTQVCGTCPANHSCDPTAFTCVKTCDLDPITANKTINIDLKTYQVSGTVTLNGQQMPDDPNNNYRAYLRFTDRLLNDSISTSLGATGPGNYNLNIFTGTYDLSLGEGSSSQKVLPKITHPLMKGCLSVAGCTASKTDLSDSWRLVPDAPYWVDVNMTIKQSGGSLTGPWSSQWGSGTIANGKVNGDNVSFEYADNYCSFRVSGTLLSGCLMNGYIQGYNSCTYPAKYSNFIGLRLQ